MRPYSDFAPTGFDRNIRLGDEQDSWWVAPCGQNRDSGCLDRSNWLCMVRAFDECDPEGRDYAVHSFSHWACGWFEICLVRPGSKVAGVAHDIECALADYPILDEMHYSEMEFEEACEIWEHMSIRDRVYECQRAGVSVFAARRDEIPEGVDTYDLTGG